MRVQIILASLAVLGAIIALIFSKFVRAVVRESIVHPHHHCEIEVDRGKVSHRKIERS